MSAAVPMTIAGLLASFVLAGSCDAELCGHPRHLRCEGDVLAYCPGGWGNLDMTVNRQDCRAEGKRCVQIDLNGMREPWCIQPLGACDPGHYRRRCTAEDGSAVPGQSGSFHECIGGQLFASGPSCIIPTTPD